MRKRKLAIYVLASIAAVATLAAVLKVKLEPETAFEAPSYSVTGTVSVPAFELPPSPYMSSEAVAMLRARALLPAAPASPRGDIDEIRRSMEDRVARLVKLMRSNYSVDIEEQKIAGVRTRIITPSDSPADSDRVLINLHGGAFAMCADGCALLESVPIAALGKFKVITVDYRMAPEATFPAANEDVTAVYRELLKTYRPEQIGIYGCSAGGALSGQVAAWLPEHDLPVPGALGIFGAGAGRFDGGDSAYVAAYIDGSFPPPDAGIEPSYRSYFEGVDRGSPMVSPMLHLDVLAKFPPTLLITGTRAMDMSPAIYTHSQLLKAGAKSQLLVGEGMGHCYIYLSMFPEARDAYQLIVSFFRENLG